MTLLCCLHRVTEWQRSPYCVCSRHTLSWRLPWWRFQTRLPFRHKQNKRQHLLMNQPHRRNSLVFSRWCWKDCLRRGVNYLSCWRSSHSINLTASFRGKHTTRRHNSDQGIIRFCSFQICRKYSIPVLARTAPTLGTRKCLIVESLCSSYLTRNIVHQEKI